jgi:AcrR family transcriptional regulator
MPRTLNPTAHAVRREAFVDGAQRLIQSRGYEEMSIQDVLDELGASRGAFYHYFDGKAALLDAVVQRMVQESVASLEPVFDDAALSAPEKLDRFFSGIATWKMDRVELVLAVAEVWLADENAIVREKFRKALVERLAPLLARVIAQGQREGVFAAGSPHGMARVFVSLMQAANETASELFVARQAGRVGFEEVDSTLTAYAAAFERVLGAPPGAYRLFDRELLHDWFG